MTYLSSALGNFYERRRGRIFFQNGMNLNQLALEMWERLGYREVDPSVISRVLKGERSFSPKQLKIFGQILRLSDNRLKELELLLMNDYLRKFGPDFQGLGGKTYTLSPKILESINNSLLLIDKLRTENPNLVKDLIDVLLAITADKTYFNRLKRASYYELIKMRGMLLYEKGHALCDTNFPSQIMKRINPILKEIKVIAKETKDNDLRSRFFHLLGSCSRVCGSYSQEKRYLTYHLRQKEAGEKGLILVKDPKVRFGLVNQILTGASYSGDYMFLNKKGERMADELIEKIGSNFPEETSYLLSCLAISKSIYKNRNSFSILEKSWGIFNKSVKKPHHWIEAHLIRGTLQTMVNVNNKDLNFASELLQRINVLSQFGFRRHQFFSQKYFDLLTNKNLKSL